MNRQEAVILCRLVRAYCPAQHFDEFTAEAWYEAIGDLRFTDCKEAVNEVGQDEQFISPSDVRKRVRAMRAERIARMPPLRPPDDLDEAQHRQWLADTRRRAADGETFADEQGLVSRDMSVIDAAFREIEP